MAIVNSDIITWYDIDEGTGTVLADESGNGDDASITGAAWSTGSGITNVGSYLAFNGGDYFDIDSALSAMFNAGQQTLSFWINFTDKADSTLYSTNNIGSVASIQSYLEDNTPAVFFAPQTINQRLVYAASNITTGTWEHWCIVFDGTLSGNTNRFKLYVNGALASVSYVSTIGTTTTSTSNPLRWGMRQTGSSSFDFNGGLAQFAILDRGITATEVGDIYNSGAGTTYSSLIGGGGGAVIPNALPLLGLR